QPSAQTHLSCPSVHPRVLVLIGREGKGLRLVCRDAGTKSANDLVADVSSSGPDHANILRSRFGQVQHASTNEGAAVVDSNDYTLSVLPVRHLAFGAKLQRLMRRRK